MIFDVLKFGRSYFRANTAFCSTCIGIFVGLLMFRTVIFELITKAIYFHSEGSIQTRYYEPFQDQIPFLKEALTHYMIVAPSFVLAGGVFIFIKLKGPKAVFCSLCCILKYIIFFIFLGVLIYSPLQFVLIVLPMFSAYCLVTCYMKNSGLIFKVNLIFVCICLQVVLVAQGLSLLQKINAYGFLTGFLIIFVAVILKIKIPRKVLEEDLKRVKKAYSNVCTALESDPLLGVLVCFLTSSLIWRILMMLYVPSSTSDSMHYHLSRVAYWIQQGSFSWFYTHNIRQVVFPFNSEILLMWLMIALKNDVLCGLIQYTAYLLLGSLLFKIFHDFLKKDFKLSLLFVCLYLSLPLLILQNTTTENDLIALYFIVFSMACLLNFKNNASWVIVSAVALAFAVGIKSIALVYLIALLCVGSMLYFMKKLNISLFFKWIGSFVLSFFVFSAYPYIQNFLIYKNPMGPADFILYHQSTHHSMISMVSAIAQNAYLIITNQAGMDLYFGKLANMYSHSVAFIGEFLFRVLRIPVNYVGTIAHGQYPYHFQFFNYQHTFLLYDNLVFYGIVGACAFFSAFYFVMKGFIRYRFWKESSTERIIFFFTVIALLNFIFVSLAKRWDPWMGRHFLLTIFFSFPSLMYVVGKYDIAKKVLIYYAIFSLIPATLMDTQRALVPYKHNWRAKPVYVKKIIMNQNSSWLFVNKLKVNRDRLGLRCMLRPYTEAYLREVNKKVPLSASLGIILTEYQWDFPLFGKNLNRKIYPVNSQNLLKVDPDYLLLSVLKLYDDPMILKLIDIKYDLLSEVGSDIPRKAMRLYKRKEI